MYKFAIDRKIWLRGEGDENSFLYRGSDGKQCCMGILCSNFRDIKEFRGQETVGEYDLPGEIWEALNSTNGFVGDIVSQLIALFAAADIKVEFHD